MLGFLGYIFVTIIVIIFILVLIYYYHNNYITFSSMFITILFVGIFALIVLISDYSTEKNISTAKSLVIKNHYELYLNGEKVKYKNIIFRTYSVKIDNKNKKVILSSRK